MGRIPKYVKEHGVLATVKKVNMVVARKVGIARPQNVGSSEPRIVIVAHQLDLSGAPFVIMEVAKEMKELYPDLPLDFFTFHPTHRDNILALNQIGIKPKIIDDREATIAFNRGDVVILNSVSHRDALLNDIFKGLQNGSLRKLIWYVHEDNPDTIFSSFWTTRIKEMLKTGRMEFRAAGTRTTNSYKKYFDDTEHIHRQQYRLRFEQKYHRVLQPSDFSEKIKIVLPGTLNDGRKGQLPIFYAFADFLARYYKPNPDKYRDFELIFVTLDKDFLSKQIEKHEGALEGRFVAHGRLSHEKTLAVIQSAHVTACYSLREALPLFVFEGMIMGHPVLRNDCSGMEEQLIEGENGFYLDSNDFRQVVETIERMLNREKTTDPMLAAMSAKSYEIAKKQALVSYKPLIDSAHEAFVRK